MSAIAFLHLWIGAQRCVREMPSDFSGNQVIVGEDNISAIQFRTIRGLEFLHSLGATMSFVCSFILENKKMNKARRIFLLLPCQVHSGAGLVRLYVGDKFLNGALHLIDSRLANSIFCDRVYRHRFSVLLLRFQNWSNAYLRCDWAGTTCRPR